MQISSGVHHSDTSPQITCVASRMSQVRWGRFWLLKVYCATITSLEKTLRGVSVRFHHARQNTSLWSLLIGTMFREQISGWQEATCSLVPLLTVSIIMPKRTTTMSVSIAAYRYETNKITVTRAIDELWVARLYWLLQSCVAYSATWGIHTFEGV